jgi:hypothetical protein
MGLLRAMDRANAHRLSMRNKRLRPYRERVAGGAEGRILDVKVGSGLNLPSMDGRPSKSSDDPSPRLLARAHSNASTCKFLSTSSKVQPNVSRWRTAAWIRS